MTAARCVVLQDPVNNVSECPRPKLNASNITEAASYGNLRPHVNSKVHNSKLMDWLKGLIIDAASPGMAYMPHENARPSL